ncbi:MAG TPA: hypothetical protein VGG65_09980 [Thermoanaerobaculia bacterium]
MKRTLLAVALLLCAAPGVLGAEEPAKTSPTVAREIAESNEKTPAGRRYESALNSSLDSWLRKSLERCLKGVAKDQVISFDVLVRIGPKGDAEEVLFSPDTSVGRCAEPDFRDAKYPSPPQPGWWVKIGVGLR